MGFQTQAPARGGFRGRARSVAGDGGGRRQDARDRTLPRVGARRGLSATHRVEGGRQRAAGAGGGRTRTAAARGAGRAHARRGGGAGRGKVGGGAHGGAAGRGGAGGGRACERRSAARRRSLQGAVRIAGRLGSGLDARAHHRGLAARRRGGGGDGARRTRGGAQHVASSGGRGRGAAREQGAGVGLGGEEQRVLVVADFTSDPAAWRRLGDGYRVESRFVLWQADSVLQVPSSALFRHGEGWAAFVVQDGKARRRDVNVGERNGLMAQIVAGLTEGERVVTHPDLRTACG